MTTHQMVPGLAVTPGTPHSLHMAEIELPELGPDQVEVRVLEAGICGTDREIIESKLGSPPPGSTDLVIGHEVLGEVVRVGSTVKDLLSRRSGLGDRPSRVWLPTVRSRCI